MPLSTTATGYHVAGLKVMTNPTRPASGACQATGSHQGSSLRRVVIVGRVPCERVARSEEHTSELQSQSNLVCRLLLEKKTVPGVTPQYPIAAVYPNTAPSPTSPWAMPSTYTAGLTVAGQKYAQPLQLTMDPRVHTSTA